MAKNRMGIAHNAAQRVLNALLCAGLHLRDSEFAKTQLKKLTGGLSDET
jgi:hypothetical protein